jgi:hypothetical protein
LYRPGTPHSGDTHTQNIYTTRLAREIPTDPEILNFRYRSQIHKHSAYKITKPTRKKEFPPKKIQYSNNRRTILRKYRSNIRSDENKTSQHIHKIIDIYLDMIGRQQKIEGILMTFPQERTELTDPSNKESPKRNPSPKCRKSKTHHHTDTPIRRQNLKTKYTPPIRT